MLCDFVPEWCIQKSVIFIPETVKNSLKSIFTTRSCIECFLISGLRSCTGLPYNLEYFDIKESEGKVVTD